MGRAVPGVSILPFVLMAIAIGSLAAYARQGRWLRRIGVVILVAVVGWALSGVVDQTVPSSLDRDRGWVSGESGEVSYGLDGLTEHVTYRLAPGESFTIATKIRNPGALPLTILGLDGDRTTQPNPYVGSIVSLGWVVQPTDGPITYLSADPADASASWPVTLGPGEELAIAVVGRAGPCADPAGTVTRCRSTDRPGVPVARGAADRRGRAASRAVPDLEEPVHGRGPGRAGDLQHARRVTRHRPHGARRLRISVSNSGK